MTVQFGMDRRAYILPNGVGIVPDNACRFSGRVGRSAASAKPPHQIYNSPGFGLVAITEP